MSLSLPLPQVIAQLKSPNASEREATARDFAAMSRLGLNTCEALHALQAAASDFPLRDGGKDSGAELIRAASRTPQRVYVPIVADNFARFSARGKVEALRLLLSIGDRKAAQAYMALVRAHGFGGELRSLASEVLRDEPRHLDVYFPELLAFAAEPMLAAEVCDLAVGLCDEGLLDGERLGTRVDVVLGAVTERLDRLERLDAREPDDERVAEALAVYGEAVPMLELLGHLRRLEAEPVLQRALACREPRLKAAAIAALIRFGRPIDPTEVAVTACDPDARRWLVRRLRAAGCLSLLERAGQPLARV